MNSAAPRRWAVAPAVAFVLLAGTSVLWLTIDRAPLVFDPSAHLFSALYFDAFPGKYLTQERQYYPPLVHIMFATSLRWTNYNIDASIAAVALPFLALLLTSIYLIGAELWSPRVGAIATVVLGIYPATYIHSRSLLLDLPLMAMVTAAIYALIRTRGFQDLSWSIALGVACAVGLLTKQMFFAAIAAPLVLEILRAQRNKHLARNVAAALVPVLAIVLWWYVPRLDWFLGDYRTLQEEYARSRHDPETSSIAGMTYYLRGTWHQTTLVFAVLWVVTLPWFLRGTSRGLMVAWWGGVFVTSAVLVLKDSRFLMPALPAIALMTGVGLDRMRNGMLVLAPCVVFGLLQLYAASFGAAWLPEGQVITNRVEADEDVQWFAQHWRMTAADSSIADHSGWGGAAEGLANLEGRRIAIVGDRIVFAAARNPRLSSGSRGPVPSFTEVSCADPLKLRAYDTIVVQPGGRFGVRPVQFATCTEGLVEQYRITVHVPRLLPGVKELIVFRPAP